MLRSFLLRHIVALRFIALFILPLAIIAVPTVAYICDMRSGEIMTQRQWDVAHGAGGGLWSLTYLKLWEGRLILFAVVVTIVGAVVSKARGGLVGAWIAHGALVVAAAFAVLFLYGYLFIA